ncbi:hypothetical protein GCM10028808_39180 [Spirosoma migulaei]
MNTSDQLQLGVSTVLKNVQNAVVSAEDFSARQISHLIDELGPHQTLTVKKAHLINFQDLERLCGLTSGGKITFDFCM